MTDKYNKFCGNCRFGSFFYKDKPFLLRMQALEKELEEEQKFVKHLQERLGDLE